MDSTVLIPQDVAEEGKRYLTERGYLVRIGSGSTVQIIRREVVDCQAILTRTAAFPAEVIEAGRKLKVIARHGVGFDNIDVKHAAELGVWVTNTPEALSATVAEHVLGLIVALARNLARYDRELRRGNFDVSAKLSGMDLEGKTLGIIGLGRIGRTVARKAAAGFGMRVIALDPLVAVGEPGVQMVGDLSSLLSAADVVSLHVPSNPETRGMIGAPQLALMKPTAFLVNASRGDVVREEDLIEALRAGRIAGAGLDVFAVEPPGRDNPLFALENVVATPHVASNTRECLVRMAVQAVQGIHEVLSGARPTWPVNNPQLAP